MPESTPDRIEEAKELILRFGKEFKGGLVCSRCEGFGDEEEEGDGSCTDCQGTGMHPELVQALAELIFYTGVTIEELQDKVNDLQSKLEEAVNG